MASRIWIGRDNLLVDSATLSARTDEGGDYALSNLQYHQLEPPFRTAGKAVELDGTNDYLYVPHHADFDITGDLTLEVLMKTDGIGTTTHLINKYDATDGYVLIKQLDEIRVYIYNSGTTTCNIGTTSVNLVAGTWYRIKAVYDASAQEISIYVNGTEVARANNSTQTGCVLTGTIPAAIGTNTTRVTIGGSAAGAGLFNGEIALAAIANAEADNGGWLNITSCVAYWNFDNSDGTDSSGNGHDLTEVSLSSADYNNCTAYQWIGFHFSSAQNPTLLFIDRRHNLSSSATMRLFRGAWYWSSTDNSVVTPPVTAGQPVVSRFSSTATTDWWLEIHDPDNPDGYIELPFIYLGQSQAFTSASFSLNRNKGTGRTTTQVRTEAGNIRTAVKSEQYTYCQGMFYPAEGADLTELRAAAAYASQGKVIVFCYDSDDEDDNTWAMYWLNAAEFGASLLRMKDGDSNAEVEAVQMELLELVESA